MKVTIYDVAKAANVSIATVSKVINNSGNISEKTRKKVKQVMKDLDYYPNMLASALMGKQTKTIGLMIPDLANPFFSELARKIEDRGHELGYNLVICNTDYDSDKENKYLLLLKQKRVDGFVLASGFENFDRVEDLIKEEFPVVIVARDFPMFSVNAVAIDDYMGGYIAANHLIESGHRNIGVVARDLWSNRERLRGFCYALEENGLKLNKHFEFVQDTHDINHIEAGRQMTKKYLTKEDRPTAIFACNDLLAAGIIQEAKELGFQIPEDLSVVGFDNTSIATVIDPPLTTVAQPIEGMGREVMDLMVSIISGEKEETSRVILLPTLVKRQTTKVLGKK